MITLKALNFMLTKNKTQWKQQHSSRSNQHHKPSQKDPVKSSKSLPFIKQARLLLKSLKQALTRPQLQSKLPKGTKILRHTTNSIISKINLSYAIVTIYLAAFVAANLFVQEFGSYGLWFSSFFLIPFDFVCRCLFHERWKGNKLILNLMFLTIAASVITVLFNQDAFSIALASVCGFSLSQLTAGLFYQAFISKSFAFKVNGSDLVGIVSDSILFQIIAFDSLNLSVTLGQIVIKGIGGLIWYLIIFKKFKLNEKVNSL